MNKKISGERERERPIRKRGVSFSGIMRERERERRRLKLTSSYCESPSATGRCSTIFLYICTIFLCTTRWLSDKLPDTTRNLPWPKWYMFVFSINWTYIGKSVGFSSLLRLKKGTRKISYSICNSGMYGMSVDMKYTFVSDRDTNAVSPAHERGQAPTQTLCHPQRKG